MCEKVDYHITQISDGIWAIDEFSMSYLYVIEGTDQAVILDTGTGVSDLKAVVEKLIHKPYTVVVTHGHMDHVGGIGQFETIHIHSADVPCFSLPEETNPVGLFKRKKFCDRAIVAYGKEALPFSVEAIQPVDMSKVQLKTYEDGDVFQLGDRSLEVIHVPAHSRGSCCLLDKKDRILFSGDNFGEVLLLPLGGNDRERAEWWLSGAKKVLARKNEFDTICAGHFCPLDWDIFHDMFTLAEKIICGEIGLEIYQVDEMLGPMYHYGKAYFSMDMANIQTRDYTRIKNPRHY